MIAKLRRHEMVPEEEKLYVYENNLANVDREL